MANATLHTPLDDPLLIVQLIPDGALVMVPPPRDAGDAVTLSVAEFADELNPTPTVVVVAGTMIALHDAPLHALLNPVNEALPLLVATTATAVPDANAEEQSPLATPAVIVHEIPSGTLTTVPLPLPTLLIASEPGASGVR